MFQPSYIIVKCDYFLPKIRCSSLSTNIIFTKYGRNATWCTRETLTTSCKGPFSTKKSVGIACFEFLLWKIMDVAS